MKKLDLCKKISLLLSGLLIFVFGLVLFIQSYSIYKDEYGLEVSFNTDFVICMIIGIIIFIYSLLWTLHEENHKLYPLAGTLSSLIISSYSLGIFFKQLGKALNKNKAFEYLTYQNYLYIGIITLAITIYFAILFIIRKKEEKLDK